MGDGKKTGVFTYHPSPITYPHTFLLNPADPRRSIRAMKKHTFTGTRALRRLPFLFVVIVALAGVRVARGEAWGGIEPFKSRRKPPRTILI